MLDTNASTDGAVNLASTSTGITLAPLPADTAHTFLLRLDLIPPDLIPPDSGASAIGAFQDGDSLIGVAAIGRERNGGAAALIAVMPDRRALGVGTDLLHALAGEAEARGLRRLLATYAASNAAAERLVAASGLTTGRRRTDGEVTVVLFLPTPGQGPCGPR